MGIINMHDLQFVTCDLQVSKNNKNHRTIDLSRENCLFLRRGQEFIITLRFHKPMLIHHKQLEGITLTTKTGPNPSSKNGTKNSFPICSLSDEKSWSAKVVDFQQGLWTLSVTTPASAIIGNYTLSLKSKRPTSFSQDLGNFMILFNPWCKDDPVFLHNEGQRQEYVLNEDGIIYLGTENCIQQHPWHFGQFEYEIADICLKLLDTNPKYQKFPKKEYLNRNDPIYVSKVLGDAISRKDEEDRVAFMVENRRPSYGFISSVPILQKWFQTGCKTVYGHHWVFAAVLCTVLRCLGIPTRPVTNYNSAYDTKRTLQKDIYYDEKGACIHRARNDSIWNFHVWNECWMERRDLSSEYNGWQVFDATAQQLKSNDELCVSGPAPVRAIKEGHVALNHDVDLIFSKLVTDNMVWVRNPKCFSKVLCWARHVGDSISTKSVGSDMQEDLVHHYKYPKGSAEEAEVLKCVTQTMLKNHKAKDSKDTSLSPATVSISSKRLQMYGDDIRFKVTVANVSLEKRDFKLLVGAQPIHDHGFTLAQFWNEEFSFHFKPYEGCNLSIQLCHSSYDTCLLDNNLLRITALVKDPTYENGNVALAEQDMTICKPCLSVQTPRVILQYQPMTAMIHFKNPLEKTLLQCVLRASGKGLLHNERHYRCGNVAPGDTLLYPITFTPTQVGPRRLYVQLECSIFRNIIGFHPFEVLPANVQEWSNEHWQEFQKAPESARANGQVDTPLSLDIQLKKSFFYGQDITIKVSLSNQSRARKDLCLVLYAQYVHRNGNFCPNFWKQEYTVSLQAHEEKTVFTCIRPSEYGDFKWESNLIRLTGLAKDVTSTISASRHVTLYKPTLCIQMQTEALQYQLITSIIIITNPIEETLEDCVLTVSGESLIYRERLYSCKNIGPGSTEAYKIRFAPTQIGPLKFQVRFDCKQFRDVRRSQAVEVLPSANPF
ncbi:protein 4.2-like [Xenopus laevis]|uniref:Protein 4.2-like n=2 Tax=Xenopus laevis TaxID=8355 RepID=A0A8J0TZL2_XENLA|nr:protein 4.2-like [Xenopus laevis]